MLPRPVPSPSGHQHRWAQARLTASSRWAVLCSYPWLLTGSMGVVWGDGCECHLGQGETFCGPVGWGSGASGLWASLWREGWRTEVPRKERDTSQLSLLYDEKTMPRKSWEGRPQDLGAGPGDRWQSFGIPRAFSFPLCRTRPSSQSETSKHHRAFTLEDGPRKCPKDSFACWPASPSRCWVWPGPGQQVGRVQDVQNTPGTAQARRPMWAKPMLIPAPHCDPDPEQS